MNGFKYTLIFFGLLLSGCSVENDPSVIQLNQGQFMMESVQGNVPNQEAAWHEIQLPDVWNASRPGVGGIGVYRFKPELYVKPDELWAILLPRVGHNAAVYLNGALLATHGAFDKDSNIWNTPLLVTLPNRLLHSGINTIDIKVQAKANCYGRLLPPMIGEEKVIKPLFKQLYFSQVTFSELCAVLALTMGICLVMIWWYRRESMYGWFALGGFSWSFYALYFFVNDLPFSLEDWVRFCFANSFVMLSSMLGFICMFMGWEYQQRAKAILVFSLIGALMLVLLPDHQVFNGVRIVLGVYALMYAVLGIALLNALRFEKSKRHALTSLIGIGINIGLGLHDWVNISLILNQPYLLQYGQPLIFLVIGRHLLKDYILALHESETTNAELDKRVQQRERELQTSLQKTKKTEQEKLLLKERERIMADIHDGVGGYLVSALSIAEASSSGGSKLVSQTIHQALDELRIVIDSLDPDEQNLSQMLAAFRYRYDQRLESRGIEVKWKFDQFEHLDQVSLEKSLQLLRILQELVTNVIKHAQADEIMVQVYIKSFEDDEKICELSVSDNGIGFDTGESVGRGLGNLKRRAEAIGGVVTFPFQETGTSVNLVFPLMG